jgi:hypothetical protein
MVAVGVIVGVSVMVGVSVIVAVGVWVDVGVFVAVEVGTGVKVAVGVGVATNGTDMSQALNESASAMTNRASLNILEVRLDTGVLIEPGCFEYMHGILSDPIFMFNGTLDLLTIFGLLGNRQLFHPRGRSAGVTST